MRRSRRRLRLRRCARMRRFRNWRSGTGCIRTRFMPGRSRFSTMRRACSHEGRAVRGMARRSASARRPSSTPRSANGRSNGISWPGGQGDERARSKSDGRTAWQGPIGAPPMRACGRGALGGLPPQAHRRGGRSGGDAPHRRTASRTSVLRLAANDLRTQQGGSGGQPQAGAAVDAGDGDRVTGCAPRHEQSRARAQDIPYLLRGRKIVEPTHVWPADVTYIPMTCGFLDLVAIIDWASRAVLAWRLSNTNDASFCAAALEEALLRFGRARIFNTDQGSTFTAEAFASNLVTAGVAISMNGRGRFMDNIFIERLWCSIKYEEVHLKAYADGCEAPSGIGSLDEPLQFSVPSPGDEQPDPDGGVARRHGQNRGGGEGCGYAVSLGQRKRVAHIPTAEWERQGNDCRMPNRPGALGSEGVD